MNKIQKQIQSLEIKSVALRKATDEYERELEELKNKASNPAPVVRRNLKKQRIIIFEKQFIEGKWSRKNTG